jgi:hypothetical protein
LDTAGTAALHACAICCNGKVRCSKCSGRMVWGSGVYARACVRTNWQHARDPRDARCCWSEDVFTGSLYSSYNDGSERVYEGDAFPWLHSTDNYNTQKEIRKSGWINNLGPTTNTLQLATARVNTYTCAADVTQRSLTLTGKSAADNKPSRFSAAQWELSPPKTNYIALRNKNHDNPQFFRCPLVLSVGYTDLSPHLQNRRDLQYVKQGFPKFWRSRNTFTLSYRFAGYKWHQFIGTWWQFTEGPTNLLSETGSRISLLSNFTNKYLIL